MSMPVALEHIDKYGEANLDSPTLRHLRDHARRQNEEDARVRATMGEELAQREWDPLFAQDTRDRDAALERINAELERRGEARRSRD